MSESVKGNTRLARRKARECALQAIYEWLVKGSNGLQDAGEIDAYIREQEHFPEIDQVHFEAIFYGVARQYVQLRECFAPFLDRPVNELSFVEHAILLLGTYELQNHLEIPYKVVINESVELAKDFGGTDGFKYVNGVLDKLATQLRVVESQRAQRL